MISNPEAELISFYYIFVQLELEDSYEKKAFRAFLIWVKLDKYCRPFVPVVLSVLLHQVVYFSKSFDNHVLGQPIAFRLPQI